MLPKQLKSKGRSDMSKVTTGGIVGIVILVIVIMLLGSNNIFPNEKRNVTGNIDGKEMVDIQERDLINFQLYKSYEADTDGLRKRFKIVEGAPFTWFVQICDLSAWEGMLNSFNETKFEYKDFDFNFADYPNKYLAITFGRELLEIKKIGFHSGQTEAAITFAEEYYGDVMYFYIMDEVPLSFGSGKEFYIMNGLEKVFQGYDDLDMNETVPWDSALE
jgi:hypothetical protein